jgi:uncharacterized protein YuzE
MLFLIATLWSRAMKVRYFEDTDTALVEIGTTTAHETRELTPDLYVDLDAEGRVVSITIEHASRQGDLSEVTFERVAVGPRAE